MALIDEIARFADLLLGAIAVSLKLAFAQSQIIFDILEIVVLIFLRWGLWKSAFQRSTQRPNVTRCFR